LHLIVLFPSFDFNIIVDVRCGVLVFYGRWFSSVFLAVSVLVPPKGYVVRSFFVSDFVRRATPSCAQVSGFPSHDFDLSSSAASVCRSPSLSDRHLAQPGLCPIMPDLYPIVILLCLVLRVVCLWPDSFCDLLFRSSFVVDL
jgi:hypothetical protein